MLKKCVVTEKKVVHMSEKSVSMLCACAYWIYMCNKGKLSPYVYLEILKE